MIRKDYILDRWVYFAVDRKNRPNEFRHGSLPQNLGRCFFCKSGEDLTPKEIGRVEYKGSWKIRWFLNKFPAVWLKDSQKSKTKGFLTEQGSFGVHEIIVETPNHKSTLADLPVGHIKELLDVCRLRIGKLSQMKGIKYVDVFKNHGSDAGTSLIHSHMQVVALPKVPSLVKEEAEAAKKHKSCPYCSITKAEAKSKRMILKTQNVVAFCPFASRFNYEAWIFTRKHRKSMEEIDEKEMQDLAVSIKKILVKLKMLDASYNMFIHYSPKGENLHFHIEIAPRIAKWGGFELSTNEVINSVLPEDAARFYRAN